MLRGWKSASCSGFPARSGANGGEVVEVVGNLLAANSAPKLPNQRLRPIPFMNPPVSVDRLATHSTFRLTFFYIVYFRLSKWDKAPGFTFRIRLMQISMVQVALHLFELITAQGTY